jgi:hypothetical protein
MPKLARGPLFAKTAVETAFSKKFAVGVTLEL